MLNYDINTISYNIRDSLQEESSNREFIQTHLSGGDGWS